jgi:hypothetical protein
VVIREKLFILKNLQISLKQALLKEFWGKSFDYLRIESFCAAKTLRTKTNASGGTAVLAIFKRAIYDAPTVATGCARRQLQSCIDSGLHRQKAFTLAIAGWRPL